jgi:acyl-CoA thioesterase-1
LRANLAVNGFTSRDVIERELPMVASLRPELVSLLIGVNDVVQGVRPETFRSNVATILDELGAAVAPSQIVIVSVPDYTVTPEGATYGDPERRHAAIVEFNATVEQLAGDRGVAFVDIFDVSQRVRNDRSLVARDGLHPSGAQYRLWVDRIAAVVDALLES